LSTITGSAQSRTMSFVRSAEMICEIVIDG